VLRGWRRRGAIALGGLALYALLGFFVVPRIARQQIEKQGTRMLHRTTTVERVEFNPFTFVTKIFRLDIRDRDGADLLRFERLRADFEVSGVFRRAYRFGDLRVDGLHAVGRLLSDGQPSVADLLVPTEPPPPGAEKEPFPRLIVDRLELRGGRLEFVDESRAPRFLETMAPIDLEVRDLTTIPTESGEHILTVGIGDKTRIHWTGRQTVDPFRLLGKFVVEGVPLPRVWEYAAPEHPLDVRDGSADLAWSYEIGPGPDGATTFSLAEGSIDVRSLAVRPRGGEEDWLSVPELQARSIRAAWPASEVEVGEVRVTRPHGVVTLGEDGAINWQTALASSPEAAASAEAAPPAKPWTVAVASFAIDDGSVHFEDRSADPALALEVRDAEALLEGISSDLAAPVRARAKARLGEEGAVTATGTVAPDPFVAELDVSASGIDIVPFRTYFAVPNADLTRGVGELSGKLHLGASPTLRFDGEASVTRFLVVDTNANPLLDWERATARGVRLTVGPHRLRIAEADFHRAFAKIHIDRSGTLNLSRVGLTETPQDAGAPAAPAAPPAPLPPIDVVKIAIRDARIDFTDESLVLPFGTDIHAANGTIRDLSTASAAPARLDLEGRVAETGYVKAGGTLRIADPFASTDISVTFRDVAMPKLTPYFAQFAGYAVKEGSLDLDLRYQVHDRRLVGDHRIVAKDLVLGEKVESPDAPKLPVRLAIALLKDKDGHIDLEVPIEGSVDSPEFAYRKVFWQAVRKILVNIAAAPFRALGRLFGKDEEDLDLVEFAAGRSDLLAPQQETLAKLAAELAKRPELTVEVEGRFDPEADPEAIRVARLEARIEEKRATIESPEAILEALYTESFSAERLAAERAKFDPHAAAPPEPEGKKKKKRKRGEPEPPPPPPKETFDAAGFYDALRAQLLEAENVSQEELEDLARARAAAIVGALTASGGVDHSKAKAVDTAPVKRKKQGSDLVASEMVLSAGD
jgi:hypothetical protein